MLDEERKLYKEKHDELVKTSFGKFVLIKGSEIIGVFNTIEEGISEGARRFGLQSFLVREIRQEVETTVDIPALTLGILSADSTRSV